MFRWRLDPEAHGSSGYTSVTRLGALAFIVGFLVLSSHLAAQAYYSGRIMPGVTVAGEDVGGLTEAQARRAIADTADNFQLKLDADGKSFDAMAPELGITYDTETTLQSAYLAGRGSWLPPLHQDPITLSFNVNWSTMDAFTSQVEQSVGTPPVDATVSVNGATFKPVASKDGYTIDRLALVNMIEAEAGSPASTNLSLSPHVQLADIQVANLTPTIAEAKKISELPITLTYDGRNVSPTQAQIAAWLDFAKKPDGAGYELVPVIDQGRLKGYVNGLANFLEVSPVNELETTVNGVSKVTRAGVNGTTVDQNGLTNALENAVNTMTPLTYVIQSSVLAYQTLNTSLHSLNLPAYVEVNLTTQHLWVWQNGQVIYDSPVTSGATGAGFGTPTGLFAIYYKAQNVWLNGQQYGPLYDYNDFVQYWMPFYSGYGLHDASWRHGLFGETSGASGYWYDGSHGCVNLPLATAQFIYNWSHVGTPVWVHN